MKKPCKKCCRVLYQKGWLLKLVAHRKICVLVFGVTVVTVGDIHHSHIPSQVNQEGTHLGTNTKTETGIEWFVLSVGITEDFVHIPFTAQVTTFASLLPPTP